MLLSFFAKNENPKPLLKYCEMLFVNTKIIFVKLSQKNYNYYKHFTKSENIKSSNIKKRSKIFENFRLFPQAKFAKSKSKFFAKMPK